jgi:inhibitor of cysteine peptidase
MDLGIHDTGRSISVCVNDIVTLRLNENPTTGFLWEILEHQCLRLLDDSYEGGSGIGASGVHSFRFRMTCPGSHRLRLKHRRSWEGEDSVLEVFDATLVAA